VVFFIALMIRKRMKTRKTHQKREYIAVGTNENKNEVEWEDGYELQELNPFQDN